MLQEVLQFSNLLIADLELFWLDVILLYLLVGIDCALLVRLLDHLVLLDLVAQEQLLLLGTGFPIHTISSHQMLVLVGRGFIFRGHSLCKEVRKTRSSLRPPIFLVLLPGQLIVFAQIVTRVILVVDFAIPVELVEADGQAASPLVLAHLKLAFHSVLLVQLLRGGNALD